MGSEVGVRVGIGVGVEVGGGGGRTCSLNRGINHTSLARPRNFARDRHSARKRN